MVISKRHFYTGFATLLLLTAQLTSAASFAANTDTASPNQTSDQSSANSAANIEVSPDSAKTTQEELATIYVLSEICPKLIGSSKAFNQGYARLVKDYWQQKGNPVQALALHAQTDQFKKYLVEAQQNAQSVSAENNRDVCNDVIAYR